MLLNIFNTYSPLGRLSLGAHAQRLYTVLAWGRSLEGQCGDPSPVVTRPTPLLDLHGVPITHLAASKLTSAAVAADGTVYTFGDGWGGKLGHGGCDSIAAPTRIESFVGRANIRSVACGDHHTLFMDSNGQVWACGEGKEGQLGLGTPLDVIAQQRHAAYQLSTQQGAQSASASSGGHRSAAAAGSQGYANMQDRPGDIRAAASHQMRMNPPAMASSTSAASMAASTAHQATSSRQQQASTTTSLLSDQGSASRSVNPGADFSQKLKALIQSSNASQSFAARHGSGSRSRGGGRVAFPTTSTMGPAYTARQSQEAVTLAGAAHHQVSVAAPLQALAWGGNDWTQQLTSRGAQPGHQVTPARLGRDLHPLAQPSSIFADPGHVMSHMREDIHMGLESQHVLQVAAGKHYSVAVDGMGQVWTWGACFNGCLGSHTSWISTATRVDGELAAVLEAEGGATSVAAGGSFCLALTKSNKVVVWGTPPIVNKYNDMSRVKYTVPPTPEGHMDRLLSSWQRSMSPRSTTNKPTVFSASVGEQTRVQAGVIPGLPPITHIAAGQQHALLSDGESVWFFGRGLDETSTETGAASWHDPVKIRDLGSAGVKCVRAGSHSSAVVTHDGDLHMWGRLMDAKHASMLFRRMADVDTSVVDDESLWRWPGWGGPAPALVHGLSGPVRDVALGGWHAVVLLD